MINDFAFLKEKYGVESARSIFEKICFEILDRKFKDCNVQTVVANPGDDGIDVFVGEFDDEISVYQCKFFIDGFGESQKSQIRESFKTCVNSDNYTMKDWFLCLPIDFDINNHKWWASFKKRNEGKHKINIHLLSGSQLLTSAREYNIYRDFFTDEQAEILKRIEDKLVNDSKLVQYDLVEEIKNPDSKYIDDIFSLKLLSANLEVTDEIKNEFYNAEIFKAEVESQDRLDLTNTYNMLRSTLKSLWSTQYIKNSNVNSLDILVATYEKIEQFNWNTIESKVSTNMVIRKGIIHELSNECSIGWVKNYKQVLEKFIQEANHDA